MFTHDDRSIRVLLADLTDVADTVRDLDPAAPRAELTALLAREHALVLELSAAAAPSGAPPTPQWGDRALHASGLADAERAALVTDGEDKHRPTTGTVLRAVEALEVAYASRIAPPEATR